MHLINLLVFSSGLLNISFFLYFILFDSLYLSEDEQLNMIEFLKAFEIWITDDLKNFENAKLVDFFEGELDAKECSKPYYLFIKMKETATNEFQGAKFNGIGITVFAVQGNGSIGK